MQLQRQITTKRWLLGKWVTPYVQFEDAVAAFEHPCRTRSYTRLTGPMQKYFLAEDSRQQFRPRAVPRSI